MLALRSVLCKLELNFFHPEMGCASALIVHELCVIYTTCMLIPINKMKRFKDNLLRVATAEIAPPTTTAV